MRDVRVRITWAGQTHVGMVRADNEDTLLMDPDRRIFIVADGMGGQAAGKVASDMAVQAVARELGALPALDAERMRHAIGEANRVIFQRTLAEQDKRGMGTTVTALALCGTRFLIGQVGDTRGYLLRDGRLHRVTRDHSYVQGLIDAGHLTPQQARAHPQAHLITRAVGPRAEVAPDIYLGTVKPRDLFLLASDGLTGVLEDGCLAEMLSPEGRPREQVEDMIAAANRHGGLDNVTAVVVRIDSVDFDGGHSRGLTKSE
jgi:protein phosphatase